MPNLQLNSSHSNKQGIGIILTTGGLPKHVLDHVSNLPLKPVDISTLAPQSQ
jgi:hypothetical protein